MAHNPVDNQQFETLVQLKETPEEIAFELRAQEGALWTGRPAPDRHLGLRLCRPGVRVLLPALRQQSEPVAPPGHHRADGRRRSHLRHHRGVRAPGAIRRAALPRGRDPRLAGGRLDGRPRGTACHRTADLADDGPPVLPGIERLRLLLHRLGGNEHRAGAGRHLLARDHPGEGDTAASRHCARRRGTELDPARGTSLPGQSQRLQLLLGIHRRSSPPSSGYCSMSSEPGEVNS